MRTNIIGSLSGLLLPLAAYAAPQSYAYRPMPRARSALHEAMLPALRANTTAREAIAHDADTLTITSGAPVRELVIIDAGVPDKAVLQSAVRPGVETVVLDAGADALSQTIALLTQYRDLEAVHLVSHGEAGAILLGTQRIDKDSLDAAPELLHALNAATRTGADLLLYGCDLAREDDQLLETIQRHTHLDVAASNDLTGNAMLGGDWELEVQTGNIDVAQVFTARALRDFSGVLRPFGSKSLDGWAGEDQSDAPSHDWDGFTTYITTPNAPYELIDGDTAVCPNGLYVSIYEPTSQFLIRSNPAGENFGMASISIYAGSNGKFPADTVSIFGYDASSNLVGSKTNVALTSSAATVSLTSGLTSGSFANIRRLRIQPANSDSDEADFCLPSVTFTDLDTDGNVTSAAGVTEPVGLPTTLDTVGEAVNVFDFTISDGGTSDGQPLTASALFLNVSGSSSDTERGKITWRLNGPDASNVTGSYDSDTDRLTFSGLAISVANGGSETYTVNAHYNDNTGITDGSTVILSVDGDTNFTVGTGSTKMGTTSPVTNGTGTTLDVVATKLVFTTAPADSVSGTALATQPVVAARDDFGNTDIHFTETVTLTEASAGSLTGNTKAATAGVATFSGLTYTATADQQAFTLTANDQDGVGSDLPTVDAGSITSDVVATKLVFTTEPAPTTLQNAQNSAFTTVPVVAARDANDILDTGYSTAITLAEANGLGSATMSATGDSDGDGTTVTIAPNSGVATFTGLALTYTVSGSDNETFNLRASSGGLTTADSTQLTAQVVDSDGTLTAGGTVTEPVGLDTTIDTEGEAVDVFDFTLTDGGGGDGQAMTASQLVVHVSGTSTDAERGKVTWRLNGPDASNVTGTYDESADTLTFSGLSISVADGGNDTYTVNAYYNDSSNLVEDHTFILSVDGDTDLTLGASGTQMSSTSAVTNGTGSTIDVVATKLAFTTAPAGSVSGTALTTQPVVSAQDAAGNTDLDFAGTVTLTEASAGSLTNDTKAATAGVATFSGLTYTATADNQAFTLTASASGVSDATAAAVTSNVVATKLVFDTQPAPLTLRNGVELDFSTDPVVRAVDAAGLTDTDYATGILLAEVNGAGSAAITGTGDSDGSANTVTVTPTAGIATFTNLKVTYTHNQPLDNETFNLRASSGGLTSADSDQLTSAGLPSISSATYDASGGTLVVTGLNFEASGGDDIDATKLVVTGEGGATYRLTTTGVEITNATAFTVTLNATDRGAVNQILNKNGASSTGGTTFNLAADDDFVAAVTAGNTADATNALTVSNVAAPVITSAAYDHDANALILNGSGFLKRAGAANDIDVSTLTLTGEGGGTYTLNTSSDVEITNGTTATIQLSGLDIPNVEALLNKNGAVSATSGTAFAIAAADNWNIGADAAVDIADASSPVTVSNYSNPAISSATYDASTGSIVVTGTNFVFNAGATNDVDASLLTLRGGANEAYTLTDSADVEITSATEFTVTLSATDRRHVNGVLNKNGTASGSATTYNLEAADNWMAGAPAANDIADTSGNGITVSNTQTPNITSATYNAGTGVVVVTGTNFVHKPGTANDVDLSALTFTGGVANATYTLVTATDVEITSDTSFTFTLSGDDQTNVASLLDQLGTTSSGGSTYDLTAADDWMAGADANADVADAGPHTVTVAVPPALSSATYDANTGVLVVTGSNIPANGSGADIDAGKFTFSGEGGAQYTLTDTSNVERDSITQFELILSATDRAAVNLLVNRNGSASTGGTSYNLAAADDFATAFTDGDTADATNAITVSNVAAPAITGATYDAATGSLVVTGTGMLRRDGAANDIDASMLSLIGEGGASYTLSDSADVDVTSGTAFTVTLSAADQAAVHLLLNRNGTASTGGTTYNLAAAEDWARGADAAVSVADTTGNGVTVSNVAVPAITSASYDFGTGVLTITGSGFTRAAGATNDVDASAFTFTGKGSATYTLTTTPDVEVTSGTAFALTLSAVDKAAVNALLDTNGTAASDAAVYNLAAAEDWARGADAGVVVADATTAVTVSGVPGPIVDDDDVIDEPTDNTGNTLTNPVITEGGTVEGGTLDGTVTNDGLIRNVTLTPNTVITGDGTVSGAITGDPTAPATIETNIAGDAVLTNVVIGAGATVDPNAQLNGNVRFESAANIPPGLDLTRALDAIPWDTRPQTLAVNLDSSLLAAPGPDDLTLLQQIRALNEYSQLDTPVQQDQQTGELVVTNGLFTARVVPISVTQAGPGTPAGTRIDEDGNIEITTASGVRVVSYPAPADPAALESAFGDSGVSAGFNELGNLEVTGVDGAQYTGRPVATAVPAFRSTTPGVHFYGAGAPANATGVSMVYEDANGVLWEQELVPVPSDWPALKNSLQLLPGATDTRISQDGIVSVTLNGNVIRARAAYVVSPGTPTGNTATQLTPAGDLNGDGIGDYIMTFPDGSTQSLLILP